MFEPYFLETFNIHGLFLIFKASHKAFLPNLWLLIFF